MMEKRTNIRSIGWVALMGGCFLISCSYGLRIVRDEMRKIKNQTSTYQELQKLARQNSQQISALAKSIQGAVVEPEQLFQEDVEKDAFEWEDRQTVELPEGFRLHKVTMAIQGMKPDALTRVVTQLENSQPAWRITQIQMAMQSGNLSGSLQLEALDKSPLEL